MKGLIGQILLERYRVEEFIASGRMGSIYRVQDLQRNVPLALKLMHADLAREDPSAFKSFKREAAALQNLQHPHIVPFYGLHQAAGLMFLLQAYIDGPTLKEEIERRDRQPFSIDEALAVLKPLCSALGYAHNLGVVHCDVKPGNVLIDPRGVLYLADFGIARHADSTITTTLAGAGTPAYSAPEQLRGLAVSPATDIYALGVLLYELLAGRRPFVGDESVAMGSTTLEKVRYGHLALEPVDPRQYNSQIPTALVEVIRRALSKAPEERFPTTKALFEAACSAASIEPEAVAWSTTPASPIKESGEISSTAAAPQDIHPTLVSQKRRQWTIWIVGAVALIAILISSLLALNRWPPWAQSAEVKAKQPSQAPPPTSIPLETLAQQTAQARIATSAAATQATQTYVALAAELSATAAIPANSWKQGRLAYLVKNGALHDIYFLVLAVDGTPERILPAPNDQKKIVGLSFSPDGKQLAYNTIDSYTWVLDPTGSKVILSRLGACSSPTWTSDGQMILCLQAGYVFAIIDSAKGGVLASVKANSDGTTLLLPQLSPLGNEVVYTKRDASGVTTLWSASLVSAEPVLLAGQGIENTAPCWSPDGQSIAYQANSDTSTSEIWVMDRDGKNRRRITQTPGAAWSRGPAWSPDGNWLAFISNREASQGFGYGEVYLVSLLTGETIRITNTGGAIYDYRVAWGK